MALFLLTCLVGQMFLPYLFLKCKVLTGCCEDLSPCLREAPFAGAAVLTSALGGRGARRAWATPAPGRGAIQAPDS